MAPKKRKRDEVSKDEAEDDKTGKGKEEEETKQNPEKEKADGKDSQSKKEEPPAKKSKNRCAVCSKRVGLTGITCRCGSLFCGYHRYSDRHNCSVDYKALGSAEVKKNNPRVAGKKIDKV